ncbi:MAG: Ig-like domain-containing protein, partial [Erysipelotrichaceae bacterium]|nr:Ig-like domain-containing protein [Erysipelotrichaceae bacterium]
MKKLLKTMLVLVMSFALVAQFPVNVHAEDETIKSIELYCDETTLVLDSDYNYYTSAYVNISPWFADYESIEWDLSDDGIVSLGVDEDDWAWLEAESEGCVTLTVTVIGNSGAVFTDSCEITVVAPVDTVDSISLDETEVEIYDGNDYYIVLSVEPINANYTVEWSSSDEDIVELDSYWGKYCYFIANSAGNATITAKVTDGNGDIQEISCEVTVLETPALESFEIDETITSYVDYYDYIEEYPSSYNADYEVEWSSSNESVVTVDEWGEIYCESEGTATITATATDRYGNTFTDTCEVTVLPIPALESFEIDETITSYVDY